MPRRTLDQHHSAIEAAHSYNIILDQREIFLKGEVDTDGELGDAFLKNLRILLGKDKKRPIVIHQHSLGGDWACGVMIRDAIATCPAPIVFICHGITASMGSVIPMGCVQHGDAYRINMPSCDWLIHDGTTDITNDHTYKQSVSWAEWEKRTRIDMMNWYVAACIKGPRFKGWSEKMVRKEIISKLDAKEDWWLTAREAVEHGFADAVLGDEGFESIDTILEHWQA